MKIIDIYTYRNLEIYKKTTHYVNGARYINTIITPHTLFSRVMESERENIRVIISDVERIYKIAIHGSIDGAFERLVYVLFDDNPDMISVIINLLESKDKGNHIIAVQLITDKFKQVKNEIL